MGRIIDYLKGKGMDISPAEVEAAAGGVLPPSGKKYGLHITGGSDFHGERVKPEIQMAALEMDVGWLLET